MNNSRISGIGIILLVLFSLVSCASMADLPPSIKAQPGPVHLVVAVPEDSRLINEIGILNNVLWSMSYQDRVVKMMDLVRSPDIAGWFNDALYQGLASSPLEVKDSSSLVYQQSNPLRDKSNFTLQQATQNLDSIESDAPYILLVDVLVWQVNSGPIPNTAGTKSSDILAYSSMVVAAQILDSQTKTLLWSGRLSDKLEIKNVYELELQGLAPFWQANANAIAKELLIHLTTRVATPQP